MDATVFTQRNSLYRHKLFRRPTCHMSNNVSGPNNKQEKVNAANLETSSLQSVPPDGHCFCRFNKMCVVMFWSTLKPMTLHPCSFSFISLSALTVNASLYSHFGGFGGTAPNKKMLATRLTMRRMADCFFIISSLNTTVVVLIRC